MKRTLMILLFFLLIMGCSKFEEEELIKEIKQLDTNNSIVDTVLIKFDALGKNGEIQSSVRNNKDVNGHLAFEVINEIFNLDKVIIKPEVPKHNFGLFISVQRKEDLKNYNIYLMVDSEFNYLNLISVESSNNELMEYNEFFELNETLRNNIKEIINSESISR